MENPTPHIVPETLFVLPTSHVPNSILPVLIYHNALVDSSPENILATIGANQWKSGGLWKAYMTEHFHSITHECYAIIRGESTFLLGRSPLDQEFDEHGKQVGRRVKVRQGDVIVLPAGVSHCSADYEDDFEYVALYPDKDLQHGSSEKESEKLYDMNFCKDIPEKTKALAVRAMMVPIPPRDPLYGADGPLLGLWKNALASSKLRL